MDELKAWTVTDEDGAEVEVVRADDARALAARVERLQSAIHEACMAPVSVSPGTAEAEELQDLREDLGAAAEEAGDVSLASLKASWQAEVLDVAADKIWAMPNYEDQCEDTVRAMAETLRRQARGEPCPHRWLDVSTAGDGGGARICVLCAEKAG